MNVTELPFNKFIGLKSSDNPVYFLMLENKPEYCNHLETVHASAQFALAEATSGHFLINELTELNDVIPVVRKVEVKYRKPAIGKIYSIAKIQGIEKKVVLETVREKGRILLNVEVSIFDEGGRLVMQSQFEWFIVKK